MAFTVVARQESFDLLNGLVGQSQVQLFRLDEFASHASP
jgi:hypothetical protein